MKRLCAALLIVGLLSACQPPSRFARLLSLTPAPRQAITPSPPPLPPPPPPPAVAIFGDSLLVLAEQNFIALSAGQFTLELRDGNGTDVEYWTPFILAARSRSLVIALGTNDAGRNGAAPWATLLNRIPASQCVVWPKVYEPWPYLQKFNADMVVVLAAHPNVHVVDWNASVQRFAQWWMLPDGIHYNPTGTWEYAKMLQSAATLCL